MKRRVTGLLGVLIGFVGIGWYLGFIPALYILIMLMGALLFHKEKK